MKYSYKKTPKIKKTAAIIFVMIFVATGLFCFLMGGIERLPLPLLAQFLGVILITVGVYIFIANVSKEMIYEISPTTREVTEEDVDRYGRRVKYDFIIAQNKGYRQVVVCRVGLDEVVEACEINRFNRKDFKSVDKNKKRYNYDSQFAAGRQLRVCINDDTVVYLTYDEELLKILRKK